MVAHELSEIIEDTRAIVVLEWGDIVSDVIPHEYVKIIFDRTLESEESRNITIVYPTKYNYIIEGK